MSPVSFCFPLFNAATRTFQMTYAAPIRGLHSISIGQHWVTDWRPEPSGNPDKQSLLPDSRLQGAKVDFQTTPAASRSSTRWSQEAWVTHKSPRVSVHLKLTPIFRKFAASSGRVMSPCWRSLLPPLSPQEQACCVIAGRAGNKSQITQPSPSHMQTAEPAKEKKGNETQREM